MGSREPRAYKTNAGSRIGRPQKGFEKWRKTLLTKEPDSFEKFLQDSFSDIRSRGGKLTFWYAENGIKIHASKVGVWNIVQVQFSNTEPRLRSLSSFRAEHDEFLSRFRKWQQYAKNSGLS